MGLVFAEPAWATAGDLDASFSGDGKRVTDLGGLDSAAEVVIQADGKIVVAGNAGSDFAVIRYTPTGALDSSFGVGGVVVTDLTNYDVASGLAIQRNGKIVVAGTAGTNVGVIRYLTDGSLDRTFGLGGVATADFRHYDAEADGVAIQDDGKILVAGSGHVGKFALARFTTGGVLDTTFSENGKAITCFGPYGGSAADVAIDSNGMIVAVGESRYDFAVARYRPDGKLDTTFGGGDGRLRVHFGPADGAMGVAIESDDQIIVSGYTSPKMQGPRIALARLQTNGKPDPTFGGGDGEVRTKLGDTSFGRDVAIDAAGRIVVIGDSSTGNTEQFAVLRYEPTGALDPTFGGDGKVRTTVGIAGGAYGLALQADGKIVAVGNSYDDFAVARFLAA
jgi:uncharacterized delta-60 repeat protein